MKYTSRKYVMKKLKVCNKKLEDIACRCKKKQKNGEKFAYIIFFL